MQAIDNALLRDFIGAGQVVPELVTLARWVTELGGAAWLIPLTLGVSAFLYLRGYKRRALSLVLVTAGGRLLVELTKWLFDRPRPDLIDYQIVVHSLSFPSGHAANSMIVYLALSLLAAPVVPWTRWPVPAALAAALLIGLTRPILAVHWPSDVLAGWALGIAWTLGCVTLLRRWMGSDPAAAPRSLNR